MNAHDQARSAYARAGSSIRTDRAAEYAVFARVTHRMRSTEAEGRAGFPALAAALVDNQRLWGALAEDLLGEGNRLPVALRAQLVGIGEFVRRHTLKALAGQAPAAPLVEINAAIMRGLRGAEGEVAA